MALREARTHGTAAVRPLRQMPFSQSAGRASRPSDITWITCVCRRTCACRLCYYGLVRVGKLAILLITISGDVFLFVRDSDVFRVCILRYSESGYGINICIHIIIVSVVIIIIIIASVSARFPMTFRMYFLFDTRRGTRQSVSTTEWL